MKRVKLAEIRAMLREVIATSGNNIDDVKAIMEIGVLDSGKLSVTSVEEVNDLLRLLEEALPSLSEGTVLLDENEWLKFEDLYYQRVMQPVFA